MALNNKKSIVVGKGVYRFIFLYLILLVVTGFAVIKIYNYKIDALKQSKGSYLKALSELKVRQLKAWYLDEMNDAALISENMSKKSEYNDFIASKDSNSKESFRDYLQFLAKEHGFVDVVVTKPDGDFLASAMEGYYEDCNILRDFILQSVQEKAIVFSDIYNCPIHKLPHIDIFSPILDKNREIRSVIVFRKDPIKDIYPLVSFWPEDNSSYESVLVKKEGDSIRIINKLRFSDKEVLDVKMSLKQLDIAAAAAVSGHKGIFEGIDYRGIEVFSYTSPVTGTPWFMVSKVDKAELFSNLNAELILITSAVLLFLLLAIFGFLFFYNRRRLQIYKSLYRSKKEFQTILYSIGDGVIVTDAAGNVKNINLVAEQLTGWNEDEAINKNVEEIFNIVNFDTRAKVENPVHRVIEEGVVVGLANHTLLISKNGKEFPISDSGAPIRDEDGSLSGVVLVFRDQAEEYYYRKELEDGRTRYQKLFVENPQPMWIYDLETLQFLEVNETAIKKYGYTREEFLTMTLKDIRPSEDIPALLEDVSQTSNMLNDAGVWRHILKDGSLVFVEITSHSVNFKGRPARHVMVNNITGRLEAENNLRKAEEYYRTLIEKAPDGIVLIDKTGKMIFASPSARKIFGYPDPASEFPDPNESTHPDDLPVVLGALSDVIGDKSRVRTLVYRFKTHNNEWRWVESTFSNMFHVPEVEAIVINFRDVTDRKHAEYERFKLQNIVESSINEIFVFDGDTLKFEFANKSGLQNLGYSLRELSELTPLDVAPEFTDDEFKGFINQIEAEPEKSIYLESFHRRKNGTVYPIEIRLQILKQDGRKLFFAVINDITYRKRAEQTLMQSEEKFRSIFRNDAAIKLLIDPDSLKIVDANDAATTFYGWSFDELTSMQIDQVNTLTADQIRFEITRIVAKEKLHFNFQHRLKDGSIRDVEVYSSAVRIGDRFLLHSIVHDVTSQKEAQRKINFLIRSVDQSPVGIIVTNSEGIIEYTNPKYSEITGFSADEMLGTIPRILLADDDGVEDSPIWKIVNTGESYVGEDKDVRKNGEYYWRNSAVSPVLDEKERIRNFVIVVEDISRQKQLLDELRLSKEKAEESDRLKSSFLANMSHEIRTPMNGILGFMSLLQEPDLTGEMRDEYIEIVNASGQRLLNTINDIIDISKIESGQISINKENVDIIALLKRLFMFFKPETDAKGLDLILNVSLKKEESTCLIDIHKTESVLTNLLKNAIKFTFEGSITLECKFVDNSLNFSITDTGKGVPADRLKSIFDRFVQADVSHSREFEGSGLGLAISKAFVEMMGGTIHVTSELGAGSKFSFTVPIEIKETQITKPVISETVQPDVAKKLDYVFLVAEDDNVSFLYLSKLFANYQVKLIRANNGLEAVNICKSNPEISLVFMDIKMPVMDSYTATRKILELNPGMPIIALTAFAFSEDKEKALNAGCIDYISKPANRRVLMEMLERILNFKDTIEWR
ncbi:MAG: PASResponse regulator receiverATP-binding region ATPase-likeHistidine kinase [Bacteroidetes bacterium]|nr:MAG: PASResponse regulator receiverATP-binding region ATPase-likeHistidine kinase [Bacteroidota bacterium]